MLPSLSTSISIVTTPSPLLLCCCTQHTLSANSQEASHPDKTDIFWKRSNVTMSVSNAPSLPLLQRRNCCSSCLGLFYSVERHVNHCPAVSEEMSTPSLPLKVTLIKQVAADQSTSRSMIPPFSHCSQLDVATQPTCSHHHTFAEDV